MSKRVDTITLKIDRGIHQMLKEISEAKKADLKIIVETLILREVVHYLSVEEIITKKDELLNRSDIGKENPTIFFGSAEERLLGALLEHFQYLKDINKNTSTVEDNMSISEVQKLGRVMRYYTNKNSNLYDPKFDKEIRSLRPDWFVDTPKINKDILIKMAKEGKERPKG